MNRLMQWLMLTGIWVLWAFFDDTWRDAYLVSMGGGAILIQQWISEKLEKL